MKKIIFYGILLLLVTMIIPAQAINQVNTGVNYEISDDILDNFDTNNINDNAPVADLSAITIDETSADYIIGSQYLTPLDTDSNGRPDILEVGIHVDVSEYTDLWLYVDAYINDSGYLYHMASMGGYFNFEFSGTYDVSVFFDTGEFYEYGFGVTDLSFRFYGDACDNSGCGMWIDNEEFTFYDIDTNEFDGLAAYIIYGTMVATFMDDDSNGLYDWLVVSVDVNVTRYTNIELTTYGWDVDTSDHYIDSTDEYFDNLSPGIYTLSVSIEGYKINVQNMDAYFRLYIYGYYRHPIYETDNVHLNSDNMEIFLESSLFEKPPIYFLPETLSVDFVDEDGSGYFDAAIVSIDVQYVGADTNDLYFEGSAYVYEESGEYIDSSWDYIDITTAGVYTLEMRISGIDIYLSGVSGNTTYRVSGQAYGEIYLVYPPIEIYQNTYYYDFDAPPVTYVDMSHSITYIDDDANGLYNYIEIVFQLDSTVNTVNTYGWVDIAYDDGLVREYFNYNYFNEELVIGINTITIEIDGASVWALQTSGDLEFYINIRADTGIDSYQLIYIEDARSFNSDDFDLPVVTLDHEGSVSWSSEDLDSNGLIDNLIVYAPVIINGDGSVYYQMRLFDSDDNTLGYYSDIFDTADGGNLMGIFNSGEINERAISGDFYIEVNLYTANYNNHLEGETYFIAYFDPADFDTYAVTLAENPNIRYQEIDINDDGEYDWLNVTIDVNVRIPGYYSFYGEFESEYDDIPVAITLNIPNTGITSITFGVNGWFIASNSIDTLLFEWLQIYSHHSDNYFEYEVYEVIDNIPYASFGSTIDIVSSSLNVGDSMTYENILPDPFKIVVDILSIVDGRVEATLTFNDANSGNDWSYDQSDRYMGEYQGYFPWQINPADVEVGTWFGGWIYGEDIPIQIVGTTTVEIDGEILSAYVGYDGLVIYLYEIETGVLLVMDLSFDGMILVLTDSTFTFNAVTEPVTTNPTDDADHETTTEEEDTPIFDIPAFDIFTILLALFLPVIVVGKKKKFSPK